MNIAESSSLKLKTEQSTRKQKRRAQIVDAAITIFADKGYHKTSISEIIDKAKIARGTFYLYFEGKHSIFESILEETLTDLRAFIKPVDIGTGARPPIDQLRDNVERIFKFVSRHPALVKLIFNPGLSPDDVINEKIQSFFGMAQTLLEAAINHGIRLGLVESCKVDIVASAAMGAIRGVVRHYVARNKNINLKEATETIIDFTLHGILSPPTWQAGPKNQSSEL